jgi:D-sedoheptulose 7-phosphate isomerase
MKNIAKEFLEESIETKQKLLDDKYLNQISEAGEIILEAVKNGNKILTCGNGGSAADAQHFAAELVIRYNKERPSVPAIALSSDASAVTAASNDYGYEYVFSRQVEGLGKPGDVLIGITTSGNSKNVYKAFETARAQSMKTICLNGKAGGTMNDLNLDANLIIPSNTTARIQEAHINIIHIWCELIDHIIYKVNETD